MESNPTGAPPHETLALPIPLNTFLKLARMDEYDPVARTAASIAIYSIVDEANQPMAIINGYAELTAAGRPLTPEALQDVNGAIIALASIFGRYHEHLGTANFGFAQRGGGYPVLDIHPQAEKEDAATQPEQG